jgi:hypothetical protein
MADLDGQLRRLSVEIEWPATPPLSLRLEPRRRQRGRPLVLVLAAIVIAVIIAFSVPAARSAILRFFHLGSVTVEQVAVLPPAQERPLAAGLGPLVDAAAAKAALGAPMRLPPLPGPPELHLRAGVVSTLLATPQPVLLSEFRSASFILKKVASLSTNVVPLTVGGAPGLWISGQQHVVLLPTASPRLAGNVLLWQSQGTVYRLEGRNLTKQLALRLAAEINGT